jgi:hypothetical protein
VDLAWDSVEASARRIFGLPGFVIGDDMFFGDDRLDLLRWDIHARPKEKSDSYSRRSEPEHSTDSERT